MDTVEEEVREITLLSRLWAVSPPSVKVAWGLLGVAIVVLILGELARHWRLCPRIDCRRLGALIGKIVVVTAVAICFWGLGGAVVESFNSIDTPMSKIIERAVMTQGQSFLVLRFFMPLAGGVMILSYVLGALADSTGQGVTAEDNKRVVPREDPAKRE